VHFPTALRRRSVVLTAGVGAVTVAAAVLGVAAMPTASAATATYYVTPTGNDADAGTSTGTAFRTIQRCATVAAPGDTCEIAGGVYRETVTPPRSGTAGASITFRAAPGAKVTIDGTDQVTGWTRESGNIYRAPVTLAGTAAQPYSSTPYPANDDLWANQVFRNGTAVPEAAYPAPSSDPWAQNFISGGYSASATALTYNSFPAFGDMTGAVAYFAGGWVATSATVTGGNLNGTNKTLTISSPFGNGNNNRFRLVGKRAFLTGQNQWYYDAAARQLLLWAPGGGVPADIYAKKRNYAFDLRDRSHINVTNIGMFASSIPTSDTSTNIVLDGLDGRYLSHWQTAQYDSSMHSHGVYEANHRFDSGVLLHGRNHILRNSTLQMSAGNGVNVKGSGHTVTNNHIHNVGYNATYTAAVTIENGVSDLTITRNTLHDTGRDAINMDVNTYPNPGYRNMRIAYNNIYAYAKIAWDLGGIYVCCNTSMAGSRIDHNWIHDPVHTGNGLHLDNGTMDITVDHNVIWGLKSTGDINHGGNGINFGGNTNRPPAGTDLPYLRGAIHNNTIVSGKGYTVFNYFARAGHVANTTIKNNILDGAKPANQDYGYIAGGNPDDAANLVTTRSNTGTGTDPMYTNAAGGDYTVRAGSPAIDAGIAVPGITDGFTGARPDVGAYEAGTPAWRPGHDFTTVGTPPVSPTVGATPSGGTTPPATGATYKVVSRGSGKVLGVAAASAADGAAVVQQSDSGAASQRWQAVDAGAGYVKLVNRASGKVLDVTARSLLDGAAVIQWADKGAANQHWQLVDAGGGFSKLVNRNSGKVLDVTGASSEDGVALVQWTDRNGTNQQWSLVVA